jgi:thioesterase domain-containing protein
MAETLVTIRAGAPGLTPVFCLHAEAGDVSLYTDLARHLPPGRTVLGLSAPERPPSTLERLAALHVETIRGAQASGPYAIVGECTGGALAFEVARQLHSGGQEVGTLALIDAFAPGLPRRRWFMPAPVYRVVHRARILAFHVHNVLAMGSAERTAYVRAKSARAGAASGRLRARLMGRAAPQLAARTAFRAALAGYRPASYAGALLVLRAERLPLGIEPSEDLGWGLLAPNPTIERVAGYFTTAISEPGARTLASTLARHLENAS